MRQWLEVIIEETPGTTPTATADNSILIDLEENDSDIDATPQISTIKSALPKRGVTNRITFSSKDNVAGSLQTALYHEHADFWDATIFEPQLSASPYFIPYIPTVTINRAWLDSTFAARFEQYQGCALGGFTLTGSNQSDVMRMDIPVMGGKLNLAATLTPPECSDFPGELYLWSMLDLKLNNVSVKSIINSLSFSCQMAIEARWHANRHPDAYQYSGWNPTFNANVDMNAHTFRSKYMDIRTSFTAAKYATNNNLELTYAADKKIKWDFYNTIFSQVKPNRPASGAHTHDLVWYPNYDCTNLDLTCTVTNPA